jgi:hypothetical protein
VLQSVDMLDNSVNFNKMRNAIKISHLFSYEAYSTFRVPHFKCIAIYEVLTLFPSHMPDTKKKRLQTNKKECKMRAGTKTSVDPSGRST